MVKQAKDYDPDGKYIQLWCPEFRVPGTPGSDLIFMPWTAPIPPKNYPSPMILEKEWSYHAGPGQSKDGKKKKRNWKIKRANNE
jgi:deoxyribodipyrimidine photo-lyase